MPKPFLAPYAIVANCESPATCNYIPPLLYVYRSAYGISTEIDTTIIGLAPVTILESCHEIQSRLDKRLSHVSHILPLRETLIHCKRMLLFHRDGRLDFTLANLDLKSIPGKVIRDITLAPLHCALLIAEMRHVNIERERAKHILFEELLNSLEQATHSTFLMLANLHLETQDSLRVQVSSTTGFGVFLAMGMLFEAYGSRLAPANTLYLVSGHLLEREHCSGLALTHFDNVCKLREYLLSVLRPLPEGVGAEIWMWEHLLGRALTTLNSFPYIARYDNDHPHWLGLISILHYAANSLPEVMGAVRLQRLHDRL
jgi:hypothetical protein